jgi:MFS family permease
VGATGAEKKNTKIAETEDNLKPLYARSVVNSFSNGMVSPFTGAYAVRLGASSSDMGWFQSSTNLSNNLMQVFWGRLSDRTKRRIPYIAFGTMILSLLWIPMIFVVNSTQLIVLLVVQALVGSMATPAWTALLGDLVPSSKLGRANASMNIWSSVGSVAATMGSGLIMFAVGGSIHQLVLIPLIVAAISGIASSLIVIKISEKKNGKKLNLKENFTDVIKIVSQVRKSPRFVRYCYVDGVVQFFMSISWPLFTITQISVMNASMLQLALLSVGQTVVQIVFQGWAGRLADSMGRRPLLILFRFGLITVPLAYALAPSIDSLIVASLFWGLINALGSASQTAYLLDASPEESRGSFIAVYNLIVGLITFVGSLVGGYLAAFTIGLFGLIVGLQIVYLVSIVGRGIGAALHFKVEETLKK